MNKFIKFNEFSPIKCNNVAVENLDKEMLKQAMISAQKKLDRRTTKEISHIFCDWNFEFRVNPTTYICTYESARQYWVKSIKDMIH
jgi:hypothetical protein